MSRMKEGASRAYDLHVAYIRVIFTFITCRTKEKVACDIATLYRT